MLHRLMPCLHQTATAARNFVQAGVSHTQQHLIKQQQLRFSSLPVIDVQALVSNNPATAADKQAAAAALHKACRDVGFFYVKNHGVPTEVSEGVLSLAHRWFQLPVDVKSGLLLSPSTAYRGYQPLGTNVTRHETGFTPDLHEALDFFKEDDPGHVQAQGRSPSPLHGLNPWPNEIPGFAAALQRYIQHMQGLGEALLRGIAMGLQLPPDTFLGEFAGQEGSYWVTRVIYYPPLLATNQQQAAAAACGDVGREVQLSCGEHTDYGLLTLVNQDAHVSALQVKNAAGQWVDAPPLPGTFVCNIGDCFEILTNGLYKPTLHRVLNTTASTPRCSVPFFYEPCFEAVVEPLPQLCRALVEPLPQLCRQQPPMYRPLKYGSHLEGKVLTNFEMESY